MVLNDRGEIKDWVVIAGVFPVKKANSRGRQDILRYQVIVAATTALRLRRRVDDSEAAFDARPVSLDRGCVFSRSGTRVERATGRGQRVQTTQARADSLHRGETMPARRCRRRTRRDKSDRPRTARGWQDRDRQQQLVSRLLHGAY